MIAGYIPAALDPLLRDAVGRWTETQWAWLVFFALTVGYVALTFVNYCEGEER